MIQRFLASVMLELNSCRIRSYALHSCMSSSEQLRCAAFVEGISHLASVANIHNRTASTGAHATVMLCIMTGSLQVAMAKPSRDFYEGTDQSALLVQLHAQAGLLSILTLNPKPQPLNPTPIESTPGYLQVAMAGPSSASCSASCSNWMPVDPNP